jgi:hypothetical protein
VDIVDAASLLSNLARWSTPSPSGAPMALHGWNLFHAISSAIKKFEHILVDLGPVGVVLAASFGLPDVAGAGVFALLMKAHAGDKGAKAHVQAVLARGGKWPDFLDAAAAKLAAHPQWSAFQAHVQKHVKAHTHGLIESVIGPFDPAGYNLDDTTFDPPGSNLTSGRGHHRHHHRPKAAPLLDPQEPNDLHPSANGC